MPSAFDLAMDQAEAALDAEFAVPVILRARLATDGDVNARTGADLSRPDMALVGVIESRPGTVDLDAGAGGAARLGGRHLAPRLMVKIRRSTLVWSPRPGDQVLIDGIAHEISAPPQDDGVGRVALTLARLR